MSSVNDISDELLIKSITEILESADLNVMTAKLVRNELKAKLNAEDLDSRKKQINSIITDVINELNQKQSKVKVEDKDIKSEPFVNNKSEATPKNHKQKEPKQSDDSSSDDLSDANEDNEDNDEQLARKLQNEELDSKRRTTRNKSTKSVKKTKPKRNRSNSNDNETEKPKKKRKSGYMKPCVLSPDLADFLGEPEMARHEVVKRIWSYVKDNNLLDPKNKQFAICDNQLNKIFGRKRVRMFGMMKFLAKHLN